MGNLFYELPINFKLIDGKFGKMISIAMATYNGEKYLREQLDSILKQTYSDFELIICDDCSKDATWEILEKYAQNDQRIRIYKNKQNLGFKRNFEKAISLCKGKFIALSDQDDIWENNHLSTLNERIGNYSMAVGNCQMIDSNGNKLKQIDLDHHHNGLHPHTHNFKAGDKYHPKDGDPVSDDDLKLIKQAEKLLKEYKS